jgi:hypothetical protein
MFGSLNQGWLILLQEREVMSAMSIAKQHCSTPFAAGFTPTSSL